MQYSLTISIYVINFIPMNHIVAIFYNFFFLAFKVNIDMQHDEVAN